MCVYGVGVFVGVRGKGTITVYEYFHYVVHSVLMTVLK